MAQNEFNAFDNPWDLFTRIPETAEFLTVDYVESVEKFKFESVARSSVDKEVEF